eukprot:5109819-Ditylum_brightwellii.AAC.1
MFGSKTEDSSNDEAEPPTWRQGTLSLPAYSTASDTLDSSLPFSPTSLAYWPMSPAYSISSQQGHKEGRVYQAQPREQ